MNDPMIIALVVAALALGAVCKGATGMGVGMLALPIVASFLGVPQAVAIMVVPSLATNAWQVWHFRGRRSEAPALPSLMIACAVGIMLGTLVLSTAPPRGLNALLGGMLAVYVTLRLVRPAQAMRETTARRGARVTGLLAGTSQGATGISAPLVVPYLHSLRLERETYIFAISSVFLLMAVTQVSALSIARIFTLETLALGLIALIPVTVFMPLGNWLGQRLSRAIFDYVILSLLAVMAVRFIYVAITG